MFVEEGIPNRVLSVFSLEITTYISVQISIRLTTSFKRI